MFEDPKEEFDDTGFLLKTNSITQKLMKEPKDINRNYKLFKKHYDTVQKDKLDNIDEEDHYNFSSNKDNAQNQSALLKGGRYHSSPRFKDSVFKDVDHYMQDQQKLLLKQNKNKILNFCSPLFKKYKRENEHQNKKGYQLLMKKIKDSTQMVQHIKTGQSLFGKGDMVIEYQIPVLKEPKLRDSLNELVQKGQFELSVKPSKKNLDFMECLAPPSLVDHFKRRMSINRDTIENDETSSVLITQKEERGENQSPNKSISSRIDSQLLPQIQSKRSTFNKNQMKTQSFMSASPERKVFTSTDYNPNDIKTLKRSFDFPINPAYLSKSILGHSKQLKFLTDYCKDKKIALSNNENLIMDLDTSKIQHKIFKAQVNKMYDFKEYEDEVQQLIGTLKDFNEVGFSRNEIEFLMKKQQQRELERKMGRLDPKSIDYTTDETTFLGKGIKVLRNKRKQANSSLDYTSKKLLEPSGNALKYQLNSAIKGSFIKKVAQVQGETQSQRSRGSQSTNQSPSQGGNKAPIANRRVSIANKAATIILNEQISKMKQEKKAAEKEKVKKYLEFDEKRRSQLKTLCKRMENPKTLDVSMIYDEDDLKQKQNQINIDERVQRKPLGKLISATDKIYENKTRINNQLQSLVKRIDLDRPLMLKEKLDIIWKEAIKSNDNSQSEEGIGETINLGVELQKKKLNRTHINIEQRESYNQLLQLLEKKNNERKGSILNEEKQFMNILKVVIDGGWIIKEQEFEQILNMINFQTQGFPVLGMREFFEKACEEFGFNKSILNNYIQIIDLGEEESVVDFER